jgi:hypothetical protein
MYELLSLLVTESVPDHLLNYNKRLRHNLKNRLKAQFRNNLKNKIIRNASRSTTKLFITLFHLPRLKN